MVKKIMKVFDCLAVIMIVIMLCSVIGLNNNTTSGSPNSTFGANQKITTLQADQEVRFNGTAVEYFSSTGSSGWNVQVDELISGPIEIIGHTVTVALWSAAGVPSGTIDPAIEPGDKVEVYGLYMDDDYVTLSGSEAYHITKIAAENPPSVSVDYPNGGESISIGTPVEVSAHATDDKSVTSVTFYYSSDSGSNWNLIGAGARTSGSATDGVWTRTWDTNGLSAGTNYLLKAVASDGTSTSEDRSDGTFSLTGIQSQPSVKEMWRYKTNGIVWDVEIADIDNDNKSEVIVASDKLYLLNTVGDKERSFGQNIKSVEIGDINGDRIKDIIAGQSDGIITAYRGNGLEFWSHSLTTDIPKVIAVFDLNNDGLGETLMASRECKFYLISWDGPILWSYSIGAWSDSDSMDGAIIDDIDDDTVFDTVVGGRDSKITALSGVNGRVIWDYAISGWVGSVINAGDLNGDAYDDVVVGSWDTNVYAINGYNGSLLWKFVTPVDGDAPASVAILGDINSDGTLDVAVGLDDVYALDGKTGYQIWKSTDSFLGIETIVTTDLNTDGILDVCIGTCGVDPYANVYAVNGHNGNTLWSFLEPESTIYGLTAGDIDNDGKNDIIAGSQDTDVYALTTEIISGTVGAISVSSSPSGATMHLAGFAGPSIKTPYTITNVPVGMSTITLSLDGYLDWSTNVEVRAGETTSVHAALTPISTQTEMKPDLVIYSITGIGVVGEPLTIYYTITNQGNAVAQQSYSGLYIDGKYIKKDYVDTLAPGATINQKSFDYIWDCTVGDQATIQVCADVGHQVAESNEMNNCKSDFWTCPS